MYTSESEKKRNKKIIFQKSMSWPVMSLENPQIDKWKFFSSVCAVAV
jgi:hypothetical protein